MRIEAGKTSGRDKRCYVFKHIDERGSCKGFRLPVNTSWHS
jgi:hypothetical protein